LNLESAGIIAEIVGSVGVIISLLYLAFQIRDQSLQTKQINHQTAIKDFVQTYCDIRNTEHRAELYVKALEDYESLSTEERIEFDASMMNLMGGYNKIQRLYKSGLLDQHEFRAMEHLMARIIKSPGVTAWWEGEKDDYPAPVREGIDAAVRMNSSSRSEYEKWVLRHARNT